MSSLLPTEEITQFTKERGKTAKTTCDQAIHESLEEGFLGRTQENEADEAGND